MSKVFLQLNAKNSRSCDGCTGCCEGWLTGNIYGEDMYPGKPCQFVKVGVGCTIYKKRPKDPCKTFQCSWRTSEVIPERFSPSKTGVIIVEQQVQGMSYLKAVFAGNEMDIDMLSWFLSYSVAEQQNVEWTIKGQTYQIGQSEFIAAASVI